MQLQHALHFPWVAFTKVSCVQLELGEKGKILQSGQSLFGVFSLSPWNDDNCHDNGHWPSIRMMK